MRDATFALLPLALTACERATPPLTSAEARAESSTAELIEVSTSFTLGQAVEDAAEMTVSGIRGGDRVWLVTAEGQVVSEE